MISDALILTSLSSMVVPLELDECAVRVMNGVSVGFVARAMFFCSLAEQEVCILLHDLPIWHGSRMGEYRIIRAWRRSGHDYCWCCYDSLLTLEPTLYGSCRRLLSTWSCCCSCRSLGADVARLDPLNVDALLGCLEQLLDLSMRAGGSDCNWRLLFGPSLLINTITSCSLCLLLE